MNASSGCIDDGRLAALLSDDVDDASNESAQAHLQACSRCQVRLAELARAGWAPPAGTLPAELRSSGNSQFLETAKLTLKSGDAFVAGPGSGSLSRGSEPTSGFGSLAAGLGGNSSAAPPPRRIGEYQVDAIVGKGGIGVVYRARDPRLQRHVAIKVLHAGTISDPSMRTRFMREAQAVAAIRDDHVVAIFGVGEQDDQPYLVMEYLDGGSLAERLRTRGRLETAELCALGIAVASALEAAHARGMLHRDVKPANVLFDTVLGRYKLADFGLAKALDEAGLTREGVIVGTPEFLSPEQAQGKGADARSDLFSLGTTLYVAATGASPFCGEHVSKTLDRVRQATPPAVRSLRPDLPAALAEIIERLMSKRPDDRPATAASVAAALRAAAGIQRESPLEAALIDPGKVASHEGSSGAALGGSKRTPAQRGLGHAPLLGAAFLALAFAVGLAWRAWPTAHRSDATLETAAPETTFTLVGGGSFPTLDAAVDAAASGDAIEIEGDGEISVEPVRISQKTLTISAAPRARAVLTFRPGAADGEPMLATDSELHLTGIEFRRRAAPPGDSARLPFNMVVARGAEFSAHRCAFVSEGAGSCLEVSARQATLSACRISAGGGDCLVWRAAAGDALRVENCLLEGQRCLRFDYSSPSNPDAPPTLTLRRVSLAGIRGLEYSVEMGPFNQVVGEFDRCRFDVRHVLCITWERRAPPPRPLNFETLRQQMQKRLAWRERQNAYGSGCALLSAEGPRMELTPTPRGPRTISEWERLWNLAPTGSKFVDFGRDSPTSARGDATVEDDTTVGANLDQIGPDAQ